MQTILLAEPSSTKRRTLRAVLDRLDDVAVAVDEVSTAADAIAAVSDREIDVLITGAELEDMTGLDLTAHIRRSPRFGRMPILLYTERSTHEDVLDAVTCGVDTYILFPFEATFFQQKVQAALEKARLQKQPTPRPRAYRKQHHVG